MDLSKYQIITLFILFISGMYFDKTPINIIGITVLIGIITLYLIQNVNRNSVIIWRSYWKVFGKRLFLLSLPIVISMVVLFQVNSTIYHVNDLQSQQISPDYFSRGHLLLQERFTLNTNSTKDLAIAFSQVSNLVSLEISKKYPEMNTGYSSFKYMPLKVAYSNSSQNLPIFSADACALILTSELESLIWPHGSPNELNNSGYVFPFFNDELNPECTALAAAWKGVINITPSNPSYYPSDIQFNITPITSKLGYRLRELIDTLVIPSDTLADYIIVIRSGKLLELFENKPVLAFSDSIIINTKFWITSPALVFTNPILFENIETDIDQLGIIVIENNLAQTLKDLAIIKEKACDLSNGVGLILLLFIGVAFLELWGDYRYLRTEFFNHFENRGQSVTVLKNNVTIFEICLLHCSTLFLLSLWGGMTIIFHEQVDFIAFTLIHTMAQFSIYLVVIHFLKDQFSSNKHQNSQSIRISMSRGLKSHQNIIIAFVLLFLLLYFQIDIFTVFFSDLDPIRFFLSLIIVYSSGILVILTSSDILRLFLYKLKMLLKRLPKSYYPSAIAKINQHLSRWQYYSSTYARYCINSVFIISIVTSLAVGITVIEQDSLNSSRVEIGGDMLIKEFDFNNPSWLSRLDNIEGIKETLPMIYTEFQELELQLGGEELNVQILGVSIPQLISYVSTFNRDDIMIKSRLSEIFINEYDVLQFGSCPIDNISNISTLKAKNPGIFGQRFYPFPINIRGVVNTFPGSYLFSTTDDYIDTPSLRLIVSLDHFKKFFNITTPFILDSRIGLSIERGTSAVTVRDNLYLSFHNFSRFSITLALTHDQIFSLSHPIYPLFDVFVYLLIDGFFGFLIIALYTFADLRKVSLTEFEESTGQNQDIRMLIIHNIVADSLFFSILFILFNIAFQGILLAFMMDLLTENISLFVYSHLHLVSLIFLISCIIGILISWKLSLSEFSSSREKQGRFR